MGNATKIEWTETTWNPVRGCTKISPGCKHCYAEVFAERFRGVQGHPYEQGFDLRLLPEKLFDPFLWNAPKTVFVNSMSDLFQAGVPDEFVSNVIRVMTAANWHTYQVLTKRSERLCELLSTKFDFVSEQRHIWWGVSVEDRCYGLPRIEDLRRSPAALRFLSIEPLLEDLGALDLSNIDWVIVGGESGPGYRTMRYEWVESIRLQCVKAGVPFFFKQWGGYPKGKSGRQFNGRVYDEMPRTAAARMPDKTEKNRIALGVLGERMPDLSQKAGPLIAVQRISDSTAVDQHDGGCVAKTILSARPSQPPISSVDYSAFNPRISRIN